MAFASGVLAHLVKGMPPIVRERPHLARPAAVFDRLGPRRADKDTRVVNLVNRAVAWAVMRDLLLGAADAQGEGLSCHPRHRAYARHLEKIGDVLGVVDLVEERLFVGVDIHVHHKKVLGADRHEELPRLILRLHHPGSGLVLRWVPRPCDAPAWREPAVSIASTSAAPSTPYYLPVRQDWLDRRKEPILAPDLPIVDPHHHLWDRPDWRYLLD